MLEEAGFVDDGDMLPPRDPDGRGKDLTPYPLGAATLASSSRVLNQVSVRNMMSMELLATKLAISHCHHC